MKKILICISIASCFFIFFVVSFFIVVSDVYKEDKLSTVSIVNQSNKIIQELFIEICGTKCVFENVKPNEKNEVSFSPHDDAYCIRVIFNADDILSGDIGYVTRGMIFQDTLLIKDNDIELIPNCEIK